MSTQRHEIEIRFWGVRGSFPVQWAKPSQIGSETSCISVTDFQENTNIQHTKTKSLLIFDAGTGICNLGTWLSQFSHYDLHLFFSHYHHDHIMGLTAFAPLFQPEYSIHFYGPSYQGQTVEQNVKNYVAPPFFPITLDELPNPSRFQFQPIQVGTRYSIGNFQIEAFPLNHPQNTFCFKIQKGERSLVYATDHEQINKHHHQELCRFIQHTDVLITDSSYLEKDWKEKYKGWGHSSVHQAAWLARKAQVKRYFLYHYDYKSSDTLIENDYLKEARSVFTESFLSREGESYSF